SVRISVESLSGCAWNGCPSQRGIRTLGDDLASQGAADRDELADICDDIFTVREHFGQGDWIKKGLQAYFVQLKKLAPEVAEAESQRVIEAAEARHAEVIASRSPSAA
ncbi:hypothetical protein ACQ259_22130, partial [Stutzerimonas stutzeri]|uniref:hypothetical protein n=1 Tax=Stutzerimonas stutzeri TaxID=316 RepID=UPI003D3207AC